VRIEIKSSSAAFTAKDGRRRVKGKADADCEDLGTVQNLQICYVSRSRSSLPQESAGPLRQGKTDLRQVPHG